MLQLTINVEKSKFVLSVIQIIFNGDWQLKVVSRGLSNEFQACLNILIYLASYVSWISVQNWCWLNKQCYVLKVFALLSYAHIYIEDQCNQISKHPKCYVPILWINNQRQSNVIKITRCSNKYLVQNEILVHPEASFTTPHEKWENIERIRMIRIVF